MGDPLEELLAGPAPTVAPPARLLWTVNWTSRWSGATRILTVGATPAMVEDRLVLLEQLFAWANGFGEDFDVVEEVPTRGPSMASGDRVEIDYDDGLIEVWACRPAGWELVRTYRP